MKLTTAIKPIWNAIILLVLWLRYPFDSRSYTYEPNGIILMPA